MQGGPDGDGVGVGVVAGDLAGAGAVAQAGNEPVEGFGPDGHPAGRAVAQVLVAAEQHPVLARPLVGEAQVGGAAGPQPIQRVGLALPGLREGLAELAEAVVDDGVDDGLAAGEVLVDGRGGDADPPGDLSQGDGLLAAGFLDEGGGGGDDVGAEPAAFAAPVGLAGRCLGHGYHLTYVRPCRSLRPMLAYRSLPYERKETELSLTSPGRGLSRKDT